jgi:hypothetical protein
MHHDAGKGRWSVLVTHTTHKEAKVFKKNRATSRFQTTWKSYEKQKPAPFGTGLLLDIR